MAKRPTALLLAGLAALLTWSAATWALRQRRQPSACPYGQRIFLDLPRPFMRREALLDVLAPAPGEHLLEVRAGLGYYSLAVGRAVAPDGA